MFTRFIVLLVLWLEVNYCCHAQPALYPYHAGRFWGFCTIDKKVVIPANFVAVNYNDYFYLGEDSNGLSKVFNASGKLVDSAYDVYLPDNIHVLLLSPFSIAVRMEMIKGKINRRYWEWEDVTPSFAWTIDNKGVKQPIADTVTGVNNDHLWLRLKSKNKQGIYDVAKHTFVIPMTTDSIEVVTRKFMLVKGSNYCKAYLPDGRIDDVPLPASNLGNIYDDGQYFETRYVAGQKRAMYDKQSNTIMPANAFWNIIFNDNNQILAYYVYDNKKADHTHDKDFKLFNSKGKLIGDYFGFEYAAGNSLLIAVYDTSNPGLPKKYLYDVVKDHWQLMEADNPPASNKYRPHVDFVKKDRQFVTVHNEGYTSYYSGLDGSLKFRMPDTVWKQIGAMQIMGFMDIDSMGNALHQKYRCNFYRKNLDSALILFDPELNVVNQLYDSIVEVPLSLPRCYLVKKGTKWGMLNSRLAENIPAIYDRITFINSGSIAHVTQKGRSYWIDTSNRILFGGKDFAKVADVSVNGRWLAFEYKELTPAWDKNSRYSVISKVLIIDSMGSQLAEWQGSDKINYQYILTANGKILRYCSTRDTTIDNIQVFDPETKRVNTLHAIYWDIRTYKKAAVIIIAKNSYEQTGLFSVTDLSPVLPFSNYDEEEISVRELPGTANREDGIMLRVAEKDGFKGPEGIYPGRKRPLITFSGFYSVSGTRYWEINP